MRPGLVTGTGTTALLRPFKKLYQPANGGGRAPISCSSGTTGSSPSTETRGWHHPPLSASKTQPQATRDRRRDRGATRDKNNASSMGSVQDPGRARFPPGKDRLHVVVLEGVFAPPPVLDFPHTMDVYERTRPDQVAERIKDATVVICCVVPVTPRDMDQAPYLGIIAVMAVGISWVDKAECARRCITVTNCPAGNVDAVTEHFLGLYFAARKRIVQVHNAVTTSHEWREKGTLKALWPSGPPHGAKQETLGILGYGTLGTRIASLARAVGFGEVLVSERKNALVVRDGRVSFDHLLRVASTICICVPKEPDTVDLIGAAELRAMRPDALVINVARGGIVNEAALATALREGWIAGAATDVLETEPGGPGTSPLLPNLDAGEPAVPNLTVTSHVAWYTQYTIQTYQRLLKEGIEGWVDDTLQPPGDRVRKVVVVHNGTVWA